MIRVWVQLKSRAFSVNCKSKRTKLNKKEAEVGLFLRRKEIDAKWWEQVPSFLSLSPKICSSAGQWHQSKTHFWDGSSFLYQSYVRSKIYHWHYCFSLFLDAGFLKYVNLWVICDLYAHILYGVHKFCFKAIVKFGRGWWLVLYCNGSTNLFSAFFCNLHVQRVR